MSVVVMVLNQGWIYRDRIRPQDADKTVLEYYTNRYRHSSRDEWRSHIEAGHIRHQNQPLTSTNILKAGQILTYHRPPWHEPDVPLNFDILYEDDDLMAIAKPSGLPVMPGGGFLQNTLVHQLQIRYPKNTPAPIHRLGRGTSGLLLLARSSLAKAELSRQFRDRQLTKIYRALVPHWQLSPTLTIEMAIGKIPHPLLGSIFAATSSGHYARSDCQLISHTASGSLLNVTILTGRPHQIRIHLASVGYPLVGDPLYTPGGQPQMPQIPKTQLTGTIPRKDFPYPVPGDCGYHLHAHYLKFIHPREAAPVELTCHPPKLLSI